jgi:hypothetical protein
LASLRRDKPHPGSGKVNQERAVEAVDQRTDRHADDPCFAPLAMCFAGPTWLAVAAANYPLSA